MGTWQRIGSAALLAISVGALAWMLRGGSLAQGVVDRATVVAAVFGVLAVLLAGLAFDVARYWRRDLSVTDEQLDASCDYLARATLRYWRKEARTRGVAAPTPAAVRWQWAKHDVAAPASEIGLRKEDFTAGTVASIRRDLYANLPESRPRMVVVGPAGSGKTGTLLLLLLDVLENRDSKNIPVPVWLTMGSWDVRLPLKSWVLEKIEQDYPGIGGREHGRAVVAEMFDRGRIALFLDGFDEMPASSRAAAFRQLENSEGLRLVVTSRPAEFKAVLTTERLFGAAVVETLPVQRSAANAFLIDEQVGSQRDHWAEVIRYLNANPSSSLAQVLTTPLALSLARDAYRVEGDPRELMRFGKRTDPEGILSFLLERSLHLAYPDPQHRSQAVVWLRWLALRMDGSRDLAWWRIGRVLGPWRVPRGLPPVDDPGAERVPKRTPRRGVSRGVPELRIAVAKVLVYLVLGAYALRLVQLQALEPDQVKAKVLQQVPPPLGPVALATYLVLAALIGCALALALSWFIREASSPDDRLEATTPTASYKADKRFGIRGCVGSLAPAAVIVAIAGWEIGVAAGIGMCLGMLSGPSLGLWLVEISILIRFRRRLRLMPFLDDANSRQVLRQVGPAYQFRHAALQDFVTQRR